jgi:DNA-binding Lrp family transcriptional regulator
MRQVCWEGRPFFQNSSRSRDNRLDLTVLFEDMSSTPPDPPVETRRPVRLDDTDRAIVTELRSDGRLSIRALAERLHISRASAYSRVERLVADGVITGYSAAIDPLRYGLGISAYIYLKISQHSWKSVRRRISQIPEVWHCALVSGDNDLVLLVRTQDAASLRELVLNTFQTMPDVQSTQTVLILDELTGSPG